MRNLSFWDEKKKKKSRALRFLKSGSSVPAAWKGPAGDDHARAGGCTQAVWRCRRWTTVSP